MSWMNDFRVGKDPYLDDDIEFTDEDLLPIASLRRFIIFDVMKCYGSDWNNYIYTIPLVLPLSERWSERERMDLMFQKCREWWGRYKEIPETGLGIIEVSVDKGISVMERKRAVYEAINHDRDNFTKVYIEEMERAQEMDCPIAIHLSFMEEDDVFYLFKEDIEKKVIWVGNYLHDLTKLKL